MADPTVPCRSCGASASHSPGDPMALCPFCGAPLPLTRDVADARDAQERERAARIVGVQRPEPLWLGAGGARPARRGGGLLWLAVLLAAAVAAAAWGWGRLVIP